ncbi:hypothetical protein OG884_15720 [Streptosporangium sp. NBC_01755]|uniref:hypothetical protein n=1 Tax=Streptosporangium sp. NBC_01755 TaxID=2975949 RepID=UPI002DD98025|nr:hypothetical protein [Streptosporangium sp. NBC_01755]WSD03282.1 hypothetical protein OG884_15720 [Streptosporangium sp. NBC_01755]
MSGPEHYGQAEHLLGLADRSPMGGDEERFYLGAAQVHATLALAAATALTGDRASYTDEPEIRAWHAVAGTEGGEVPDAS